MKKLFALLLVAIMALSMVACGADKTATTEAPKTDAPAATQAETTVSDEPVTIHCLHYMVEGTSPPALRRSRLRSPRSTPTLLLKTAHTPRALTTLHSCRPRSLPAICPRS